MSNEVTAFPQPEKSGTSSALRLLADAIDAGTNTTDFAFITIAQDGEFGLSTEYDNQGYFGLIGAINCVASKLENDFIHGGAE